MENLKMSEKELLWEFYSQIESYLSQFGFQKVEQGEHSIDMSIKPTEGIIGIVRFCEYSKHRLRVRFNIDIVQEEVEALVVKLVEGYEGYNRTAHCQMHSIVPSSLMQGWSVEDSASFQKQIIDIKKMIDKHVIDFIKKYGDIKNMVDAYFFNEDQKRLSVKHPIMDKGKKFLYAAGFRTGISKPNINIYAIAFKLPIMMCLIGQKDKALELVEYYMNSGEVDRGRYEKFSNNLKGWANIN